MSKSYREKMQRGIVTAIEVADDKSYYMDNDESFVPVSEVYDVLDNIEDRVDVALNALKDIHGLVEIDNVKEILGRLSDDLY